MMPLLNDTTATNVVPLRPRQPTEQEQELGRRSSLGRLSDAFERGQLQHEMGTLGAQGITTGELPDQELDRLKVRLNELGEQGDGFVGWLESSAEVLGQQWETWTSPELPKRLAEGALVGGLAGTAGGPVSATVGLVGGLAAGVTSHFISDAYRVEGGLSYLEQIDAGIEPEIAQWTAMGVGVLNAALEAGGAAAVMAPLAAPIKNAMKVGVRKAMQSATVLGAARRAVQTYGLAIGAETGTEILQEGVAIAAEELAKTLSAEDLAAATPEEIEERMAEIALKTFQAMTVLAIPGAGVSFVSDVRSARRAKHDKQRLDEMQKVAAEMEPEEAPAALEEALEGTPSFINLDALTEAAAASGDPNAYLSSLGIMPDEIEMARAVDGEIPLTSAQLAAIMQSDDYNVLAPHLRMGEEAMTEAEAKEFEASGLKEEIAQLGLEPEPEAEVAPARQPMLSEAEYYLGLQGLFRNAKDAGLTDREYESYLGSLQRAAELRASAAERRATKQELRRLADQQKEIMATLREQARETVSQEPVYAALNAIGRERLNQAQLEALLPEGASLDSLPKQAKGRRIYARNGTVDPELLADLYGFADAQIMLFQMMDSPRFQDRVEQVAQRRWEEEYGDLREHRTRLSEQLQLLLTDNQADILALELNLLRREAKAKKVSAKLVRVAAKDHLRDFKLADIRPARFLQAERRLAREARRKLREGDRAGAAEAKFRQLVNFQMAQEAYKVRERVKRQHKYFKKFFKQPKRGDALPVSYRNAIRDLLNGLDLRQFKQDRLADGVFIDLPDTQRTHYLNLSLRDWEQLHGAVKALEKTGRDENKFLRAAEKQTRDEVVEELSELVRENLTRVEPFQDTAWQRFKSLGWPRSYGYWLFNADTLLREIDGWKDFGLAYRAIKRPYDQAMSEGYRPGQVGFLARHKAEAERINRLFDVFTKQEKLNMKRRIQVPGVRMPMTRERMLAVLLNTGNLENRQALIDSGDFTDAEIDTLIDFASEKDWDFVQSVWDYLDEFWPEIRESVIRRQNRDPAKVEATPISTPHGLKRGGYYPLNYDPDRGALAEKGTVEEILEQMRFGGFTMSHTRDGHTQERVGSGGRPVKLDLFVLNNHIHQLTYDLEVGDAVRDIYKVLYAKPLQTAFAQHGRKEHWEKLDLWFGDIAMGEMHSHETLERLLRHARTGFTVSKLGFSLSTAMLQPLGLFQSAAMVGKGNIIAAMLDVTRNPISIWSYVRNQTGFMRAREATFNREIREAQEQIRDSLLKRLTPGNSAEFLTNWAFYGIIKMQGFADVVTWLAAQRKGMKQFDGDLKQANEFADRMVARAQASGIFGERTPFERGTLSAKKRQTEQTRIFAVFYSYFAAKSNVAYERIRSTNYKSPFEVINLATDLALMFLAEAFIVEWLRGDVPDDEDETPEWIFETTIQAVGAGLPLVREVVSEIVGFRGGGLPAAVVEEIGKFWEQAQQGEMDAALMKSGARFFGTWLRIAGTSQGIRTGEALHEADQGKDTTFWEYIMGPEYEGR